MGLCLYINNQHRHLRVSIFLYIMTAQIISFATPKVPEPKCSFCTRPKSIVKHLVESAANEKYICDQCIKQAKSRADSFPDEPIEVAES